MLFGRFLRFFDEIALPVALSWIVVLQARRLFTRRMDTVFKIIAPRPFKAAEGLFFRFVDAFDIFRLRKLPKSKKKKTLKIENKLEMTKKLCIWKLNLP